ncbi:hypothetical protein [Nocardioides sp.]|uniref:biotin synthase auxiliary protein BsaP n=1 Tax=Nocardioides sp. TaxID=35761 RepID=UPI002734133E|nr:hypothetical protein [Nocardioides sp.]MDP3894810.1 hypothetical protein [Nocardioides sp.]
MTSYDPPPITGVPHDVAAYCGHCGALADAVDHDSCHARLVLEPPRFCERCRRRMKVQVTPGGWSAHCVEHGTRRS